MRLFTAITFSGEMKTTLYHMVEKLRSYSIDGSFTERDNLHLTVNFIGETDRLEFVKSAMQQAVRKANTEEFLLTIGGFGRFKRKEGDICWIGVEEERNLWRLQKELVSELKEEGFFDIDGHEYKPHLTLGRRVILGDNFTEKMMEESLAPTRAEVSKISLMKSERVQGKLVYTEIYHVELDNN